MAAIPERRQEVLSGSPPSFAMPASLVAEPVYLRGANAPSAPMPHRVVKSSPAYQLQSVSTPHGRIAWAIMEAFVHPVTAPGF